MAPPGAIVPTLPDSLPHISIGFNYLLDIAFRSRLLCRRKPNETPSRARTSARPEERRDRSSHASPSDVFARERQERIVRIVDEHGRARVADLAAQFGVSAVTIRKDLIVLEADDRLVRTHGGAIAVDRSRPELAFEIRERLQADEKARIGAAAPPSSSDGESIVMDASTTALSVARQLKARGGWSQLTVITNGLRIASELAGHPGISVLMLGGRVRWEALSVVGQLGDGLFRRINVQKAFLGAAGFTHRIRPGRRDRGRGADQALDGRRGARGHRDRRPHEVGARGVRDVLPDRQDRRRPLRRPGPAARWSRDLIGRGIEVRLVGADRATRADGGRGRLGPADRR